MNARVRPLCRRRAQWLLVVGALSLGGCQTDDDVRGPASPDATLRTHVVEPSSPTPQGLAYIEAVADVHRRADAVEGSRRAAVLREGLALPVPARLGEAEILRLELATRLAETLMAGAPGEDGRSGAGVARDLLEPMLAPERSLPLDRATARALVVLGDAAISTGDDALAAGSYARAIRMMSLLRQELEP